MAVVKNPQAPETHTLFLIPREPMEQGLQPVLTHAWYTSAPCPQLLTQLSHVLWFPDLFAWGRSLKGLCPYTAHQAKL